MTKSYLKITPTLAHRIRLVVADVDGTLLSDGDAVSPEVAKTIRSLEQSGIIVGFNSGRPLSRLEPLARELNLSGPIIAENGCVAKLTKDSELFNLGYSREQGLKTLLKFKTDFTRAIREAPDSKDRLIDVGFYADGIPHEKLLQRLEGVQLLDSGYMLHLIPEGVSKGKTLKRILGLIGDATLRPEEVIVFGDSSTDVSLFTEFESSVLIVNPRLTKQQTEDIRKFAKYQSKLPFGDGFIEIVSHILKQRQPGGAG